VVHTETGRYKPSATAIFCGMVLVMFIGLMLQIVVAQAVENASLKRELRILQKANDIDRDQLTEVLHNLQRLQVEKEFAANKGYVEGIAAVLSPTAKKEIYTQLWHAGYDCGAAAQQYATQVETDTRYTTTQSK